MQTFSPSLVCLFACDFFYLNSDSKFLYFSVFQFVSFRVCQLLSSHGQFVIVFLVPLFCCFPLDALIAWASYLWFFGTDLTLNMHTHTHTHTHTLNKTYKHTYTFLLSLATHSLSLFGTAFTLIMHTHAKQKYKHTHSLYLCFSFPPKSLYGLSITHLLSISSELI